MDFPLKIISFMLWITERSRPKVFQQCSLCVNNFTQRSRGFRGGYFLCRLPVFFCKGVIRVEFIQCISKLVHFKSNHHQVNTIHHLIQMTEPNVKPVTYLIIIDIFRMLLQTIFGHLTGGLKSPKVKTESVGLRWTIGVGVFIFLGNFFPIQFTS